MVDLERSACELGGVNSFWDKKAHKCKCTQCFQVPPLCVLPDCQNGGILLNRNSSVSCDCARGFTGFCCQEKECFGGGKLVARICVCPKYRDGTHCENIRCAGGIRAELNTCPCPWYRTGEFCELTKCLNGGYLQSELDRSCACPAKYTGVNCELPICKNGRNAKDFTCECQYFWKGSHCDELKSNIFGLLLAGIIAVVCIGILCLLCSLNRKRKRRSSSRKRMRSHRRSSLHARPSRYVRRNSNQNKSGSNSSNSPPQATRADDVYSVEAAYATTILPTAEPPPPYEDAVRKRSDDT